MTRHLGSNVPVSCLETYNAQITKELGFDTIKANAMSSVGVWCALPLILIAGRTASVSGRPGVCAFCFLVPYPILTGVFRSLQAHGGIGVWTRYGIYQTMIAVGTVPYILGVIWITSNARTPTQCSVFSALYVMLTNAANSFATQMFRAEDKPKYLKGLVAVLSLQSSACVLLLITMAILWYSNRHEKGDAGLPAVIAEVEVADGEIQEEIRVAKKFMYTW